MNVAPPPYSPCPADLGERLESHGRYVQSLSGSVRIGRRLQLERVDFDAVKLAKRNLRQALTEFNPSGSFDEVVRTGAIIATRP